MIQISFFQTITHTHIYEDTLWRRVMFNYYFRSKKAKRPPSSVPHSQEHSVSIEKKNSV